MKTSNLNLKYINEIKLRDIQLKINNKNLVTNSFLYKRNKIDYDLCSYCQKQAESILHWFFGCGVVKEFWGSFKTWVMGKINTDVHLSDKNIIFSAFSFKMLNYLIVLAKYYIYKNKFYNKSINIQGFEAYVKNKFINKIYIAKINNTYNKFLGMVFFIPLFHG